MPKFDKHVFGTSPILWLHMMYDQVSLCEFYGRGQPLSFTLSFGEIPWFDEEG